MTDLERFQAIDDVRRVCDQQGIEYQFDGAFSRENLAWIFEQARLHIISQDEPIVVPLS
jgi:hypothetical protein